MPASKAVEQEERSQTLIAKADISIVMCLFPGEEIVLKILMAFAILANSGHLFAQSFTWAYKFPYDGSTTVGSWEVVRAFSEAKTSAYWGSTSCRWGAKEPAVEKDFVGPWVGCSGTFLVNTVNVANASLDVAESKVAFQLNAPSWVPAAQLSIKLGGGLVEILTGSFSAGTFSESFLRTSIPKGTYSEMNFSWRVASPPAKKTTLLSPSLDVIGNVYYTQYNVPVEEVCMGAADKNMYVVADLISCKTASGTLKSRFIEQTKRNGTGLSVGFGLVKAAAATGVFKYCKGRLPSDATNDNTFLMVSEVTGSCNAVLTPEQSVAVSEQMLISPLPCGARIELSNSDQTTFGYRKVADMCPACASVVPGADAHIDSFSSSSACKAHEVGSIGTRWTYKLGI